MSLLSGLSNLGLGKLEGADIYEDEEQKKKEAAAKEGGEKAFDEMEVLFDKSCECPVCNHEFSYRAVRTGKARLIGQDPDLRPKFENFEPAKYDVVVCPACGYAVLTKYFAPLPSAQIKLVKDNICGKVKGVPNNKLISFDDAIQRYQLALASTIVKKGKDSEKAYVCLKLAWIIRAKKELLDESGEATPEMMAQLRSDENEALSSAFEGFVSARQKESFPIAGMDEISLDYLLAVLSTRFEKYDIAQRLIASILQSKTANNRIKDRARDLKDQVMMELKAKSEG